MGFKPSAILHLKIASIALGQHLGPNYHLLRRFAASDSTLFGASVQLKKFDKELFPPFFKKLITIKRFVPLLITYH